MKFWILLPALFIVASCECDFPIRIPSASFKGCPSSHNNAITSSNISDAINTYIQCSSDCDCNGLNSNWTRVGYLDMTNSSQSCLSAWASISSPVRACGRRTTSSASCNSVIYSTRGVRYSQVCGRIKAYQFYSPNAFNSSVTGNVSLNSWYIDGVSLTHGPQGFRTHIWSFVSAYYETSGTLDNHCPCSTPNSSPWPYSVPSFVGNNYFCDTGSRGYPGSSVLRDDPLWDGIGCTGTNTCCEFNQPPWFCTTLPAPTTDNLEVRICGDQETSNENIYISNIELSIK